MKKLTVNKVKKKKKNVGLFARLFGQINKKNKSNLNKVDKTINKYIKLKKKGKLTKSQRKEYKKLVKERKRIQKR